MRKSPLWLNFLIWWYIYLFLLFSADYGWSPCRYWRCQVNYSVHPEWLFPFKQLIVIDYSFRSHVSLVSDWTFGNVCVCVCVSMSHLCSRPESFNSFHLTTFAPKWHQPFFLFSHNSSNHSMFTMMMMNVVRWMFPLSSTRLCLFV